MYFFALRSSIALVAVLAFVAAHRFCISESSFRFAGFADTGGFAGGRMRPVRALVNWGGRASWTENLTLEEGGERGWPAEIGRGSEVRGAGGERGGERPSMLEEGC